MLPCSCHRLAAIAVAAHARCCCTQLPLLLALSPMVHTTTPPSDAMQPCSPRRANRCCCPPSAHISSGGQPGSRKQSRSTSECGTSAGRNGGTACATCCGACLRGSNATEQRPASAGGECPVLRERVLVSIKCGIPCVPPMLPRTEATSSLSDLAHGCSGTRVAPLELAGL